MGTYMYYTYMIRPLQMPQLEANVSKNLSWVLKDIRHRGISMLVAKYKDQDRLMLDRKASARSVPPSARLRCTQH